MTNQKRREMPPLITVYWKNQKRVCCDVMHPKLELSKQTKPDIGPDKEHAPFSSSASAPVSFCARGTREPRADAVHLACMPQREASG
mgnify:CR=1 FL=1